MCTSSLANSSREGPDAVFGDELLRADLLICSWERCESCLFSRCFRRGLRGSLATGLGVTVAAVLRRSVLEGVHRQGPECRIAPAGAEPTYEQVAFLAPASARLF